MPDGHADPSFRSPNTGRLAYIWYLALQKDGKMLIGGQLDVVNGEPASRVARLNADGSLDKSFGTERCFRFGWAICLIRRKRICQQICQKGAFSGK
jgi:hypothetical protein